ncbi:Arm DNA-binding domain-containing protein [Salegentibacter salinarum]|uniref:Arm DNA-binding domain-containing protein n=1 Tax=Salegentibacter salinarum TaxID=447422 RepID=UPI003742A79A
MATNDQCLIYVRMTINKKRLNISLKPKVPGDLWNSKTRRLNGNSSKFKDINDFLD